MNKEITLRKALIRLISDIAVTVLFITLTFTFVFGIYIQEGNDMFPSLRDGDIVLYYRHPSLIQTEAVVYTAGEEMHIGRIAAVPGTVVSETGDHQITFNGIFQPQDLEAGLLSNTYSSPELELPITVSADSYFILNDDRTRMTDSRTFGEIDRKSIRGRVITVLRRRNI